MEHGFSKISQRLHFLRRLRLRGVNKEIMLLFYRAPNESLIRYGITTWFDNLPVKQKAQLQNLIGRAGKIIGMPPPSSLQEIFEETVRRQGRKIAGEPNHVLCSECELLPSGIRYRIPNCNCPSYLPPLNYQILQDGVCVCVCVCV